MRRHPLERAGEGLLGAVRRTRPDTGRRRRAPQVRLYDARGQARTLDPEGEPGRALVATAEALVALSEERPAGSP